MVFRTRVGRRVNVKQNNHFHLSFHLLVVATAWPPSGVGGITEQTVPMLVLWKDHPSRSPRMIVSGQMLGRRLNTAAGRKRQSFDSNLGNVVLNILCPARATQSHVGLGKLAASEVRIELVCLLISSV